MSAIYDQLTYLRATLISVNGGKPKQPRPWPRPETAAERLRNKRDMHLVLEIMAKVTPHAVQPFN